MREPKAEFGKHLTTARLRTGRSLEDVARVAGIATHYLEALEQGRGESLPGGIHTRAILRRYATAVGLDSRATVERFEQIFGPSLAPLIITDSPAGKTGPTLWHRTITFPLRCARRVIRSITQMVMWIAALPGRTLRWAFTSIVRPILAAAAWIALLARAGVRLSVQATKWTARLPVYGFERAVRPCVHAVQSMAAGLGRAVRAGGARLGATRISAPSWPRTKVPSTVVMIPATIVLTAVVTTHVVTRQGWAGDAPQPDTPVQVDQPGLTKMNLIEAGVGSSGPVLAADRTPADNTTRKQRQAVPADSPDPPPVRRAVAKKAPAVAANRNTRSRATRSAAADRSPGTGPRLLVTSIPNGARVTVNDVAWGVTPLTIRYLTPGDKTIRVTKDGYVGAERRLVLGEQAGTASVGLTLRPRRTASAR